MSLAQMLARMLAIRSRLLEIEGTAEPAADADAAVRAAFEALPAEVDTLLAEFDGLQSQAAPLQARAARLEAVRNAAGLEGNTESGFAGARAGAEGGRQDGARGGEWYRAGTPPQVLQRVTNPFADLQHVRAGRIEGQSLRSRALAAIENGYAPGVADESRSAAIALLDGRDEEDSPELFRMALLTGSPAYRRAFQKALRHPLDFGMRLNAEEVDAWQAGADLHRTALSDTSANGGYAIPFLLDPSIILTNAGAINPMRSLATIKNGVSNAWHGVTSAGVTAEWKAEGSQAADASPTLAQPAITAYLADAYIFGSYEVFMDTNLAAEFPMLIADAKNRLEADAMAVGSGSGAPFGVVTSVTAVTTSRIAPTTGGTFTASSSADVYKVEYSVPARWRPKASWISNYATYGIIRQMSPAAAGSAFWVTMGGGLPNVLLGHDNYEATSVVSTVTTGSNILVCGDFSQYYIYDRIGMSVEYVPQVFGANGRPTGQRGWIAWWRVGGDVVAPDAFRVLKL